ncbi:unnamed protein product, partial [Symbiodinium pilosum]
MNGISFSDFEASSFDALYGSGFANAKHMDEVGKEFAKMKPGDMIPKAFPHAVGPWLQPGLTQAQKVRTIQPAGGADARLQASRQSGQSRRPCALPAPGAQQVPLNDMGVIPGSRRVDPGAHEWRPSQEAHARAQNAPGPATLEAPRAAPASNQGAFVGWKSN